MRNKLIDCLAGVALVGVLGGASGQTFTTNTTPVGLEHNVLFGATHNYTVTQTGNAQVDLETQFDGRFGPSYSSEAPTVSNPTVILIEGLPAVHTQVGAWVGWSTRYWPASRFKIEGYDVYAGANTWRLIADHSGTDYLGASFIAATPGGAYEKLRFTFFAATGVDGRLGLSELFFIHPEAVYPYQSLIGWVRNGIGISLASGNVGIGTTNPGSATKLQVAGRGLFTSGVVDPGDGSPPGVAIGYNTSSNYGFVDAIQTGVAVRPLLLNASGGNVGIGTTNPSHKLAVNGTIKAKEVIVETTGWSDYVFEHGYRLAPLSEVEAHIKEKKHLPGIPSAAEVEAGGVSLGEMQARLLAKVEELTLHVIAQEKAIQSLRDENTALREQLNHLEETR